MTTPFPAGFYGIPHSNDQQGDDNPAANDFDTVAKDLVNRINNLLHRRLFINGNSSRDYPYGDSDDPPDKYRHTHLPLRLVSNRVQKVSSDALELVA